jgi:hypothetical protein
LSPIYTIRAKTIENFSYTNQTCLTPHAGPTRHMFLEVDMVEGLCSKKIAIWRAFLPKNELFFSPTLLLPAHPYPRRAHTTTPGQVQLVATQPHRSPPTPDGLRVATPPGDGGVPFPNAKATPSGIPHGQILHSSAPNQPRRPARRSSCGQGELGAARG